jgi:transposase
MRENRTSGLMSGEGKRSALQRATAPFLDSTQAKNDSTDAEAICEAVTRPNMRFVPVKSADQQAARARRRLERNQVAAHRLIGNHRLAVGEFAHESLAH